MLIPRLSAADPDCGTAVAAAVEEHGVVIVTDVLQPDACDALVAEVQRVEAAFGGGRNETADERRYGLSIQYVAGWCRQQQNLMLGSNPAGVAGYPPRLQDLIGYTMYKNVMGHVDRQHPRTAGRVPRTRHRLGQDASVSVHTDSTTADLPPALRDSLHGFSLMAGGANVIMQLARLPVGHGVATSTVDSGRVDKHPIKRLRTTTAFLMIAIYGTEEERLALRKQIDRVHAEVRSRPDSPVEFDAFDPELQLWVAACLYQGIVDLLAYTRPDLSDADHDDIYRHAQRLGTTLQVKPEHWPEDRHAFADYWADGVASIEMDDLTRRYLRGIAELRFLVAPLGPLGLPLRPLLARAGRTMNLGFLPEPFREELGYTWRRRDQHRFDRTMRMVLAVDRALPPPLRGFPLNAYLADTRRRLRSGRSVL